MTLYVTSSLHVVEGGVWLGLGGRPKVEWGWTATAFAAGQALRQQGGNALQSEVQRVARDTTLSISEGESCLCMKMCRYRECMCPSLFSQWHCPGLVT